METLLVANGAKVVSRERLLAGCWCDLGRYRPRSRHDLPIMLSFDAPCARDHCHSNSCNIHMAGRVARTKDPDDPFVCLFVC
jgi:hypothetical protein